MSAHIADDLPTLLSGEATRDVVQAASSHLRQCEDCRQELVAAVVAHASLTSARRFAPEVVATFTRALSDDGDPAAELPDLGVVFARIRGEAAAVSTPGRSRVRRYVATAIAATVVAGGAVAVIELGTGSDSSSTTVALAPFGIGSVSAKAVIDQGGRMTVDAASLPQLDARHRYEVWLTDDARTRMQPIGWIGTSGTAQLTVPANLMQSYGDIEVSVQQVDAASYDYSGRSVLRGSYR
jgi:plasmid stabilization system protein ParE